MNFNFSKMFNIKINNHKNIYNNTILTKNVLTIFKRLENFLLKKKMFMFVQNVQ